MNIKNICCIGAGYVGGPTMAVIALKCPEINVTVVDSNSDKINAWNGDTNCLPVFEPGLSEIIEEVRGRNLFFSSEIDESINKSEMIFMAVNTPTKTDGEGAGMAADLRYVKACAKNIAKVATDDKIIVEKSTLPVRTAEKIKEILNNEGNGVKFEILSNPEFLAEGTAIQDLFKSDRVLIGGDKSKSGQAAIKSLLDIYSNWIPKEKILTTNVWSSELSKLASNAMLAQRISSINSLSALCEKTGADIDEVSRAIGMDHRIGPNFLKASVGFGGSCFKKDILNLVYLCKYYGLDEVADYWLQVVKINNFQKNRFFHKIIKSLDSERKNVCLLGWAFKKKTNDSRESAAINIADLLVDKDINVKIYDPMIKSEKIFLDMKNLWNSKGFSKSKIKRLINKITVYDFHLDAIKDSDVIAILTEWEEFINYEWSRFEKIANKNYKIIDGRNILKHLQLQNNYYSL
tara:strand:- start:2472 stop:3857 length:1386 start_codon:yes stop_codon:yes gene_type:complete